MPFAWVRAFKIHKHLVYAANIAAAKNQFETTLAQHQITIRSTPANTKHNMYSFYTKSASTLVQHCIDVSLCTVGALERVTDKSRPLPCSERVQE